MWQSSITQLLNINALQSLAAGDPVCTSLIHSSILVMLCAAILCFLVSELARNYSQVDKLWSLMPAVYGWVTVAAFPSSPRLWLMATLVSLWGIRLSYNFYRKGGYSVIPWRGEEDYRWAVMRQHPVLRARWRFALFNLFFISFYQHLLILLFSSPFFLAAQYADKGLSWIDLSVAFFMLLFIGMEARADNQQYHFHQLKKAGGFLKGTYTHSLGKGFLSEGLWKYIRHPNFAAEQAIWLSFYFFGVSASGQWINWTLIGPVLLILLFAGSSALTESISKERYPGYAEYQKSIPRFIPFSLKTKSARSSEQ